MEVLEQDESSTSNSAPKVTRTGKALLTIFGGSFVAVFAVATPFILPGLRRICLPYVPATTRQVNNVLALLKGRTGRVLDLGSGDGRIVIAAAKEGYQATGVELNPWLVLYSRLSAWRLGLRGQASFYRRDMFKMEPLESKLCKELPSNGCVIACRFPLPSWPPIQTIENGIDTVWLYHRPVKTH